MVTACADIAHHGLLPAGSKATMLGPAANQTATPQQQQQQQQQQLCATWSRSQRVGYGLQNLGLTCYLNSVLQCLAHTPPLANLCLAAAFSSNCPLGPPCTACALERQLTAILGRPPGAATYASLRPTDIVQRLPFISRQLRLGRQEDAQEFLRCLVDALERDLLKGAGQWHPKQRIKYPTTLSNQLFSGILRSEVTCMACGHTSATYDPFQDLSLELGPGTHSVTAALAAFTEPERLDGDNSYRCEGCKQLVAAEKRLTIYDEPNVLVIHLKRFNFLHLEKIERHIKFAPALNLYPFLCSTDEAAAGGQQQRQHRQQRGGAAAGGGGTSGGAGPPAAAGSGANGWGPHQVVPHHHHHHHHQQQQQGPLPGPTSSSSSRGHSEAPPDRSTPPHYRLHGVVIHAGHTLNSGHYYAYVKDGLSRPEGGTGQWHRADDSLVTPVTWERVSGEAAYLLFYVRDTMKPLAPLPPQVESQPAAAAAAGGGRVSPHEQQQQRDRPPLKRPGALIGPQLPPGHPAAAGRGSSPSDSSDGSTFGGPQLQGLPKRLKLQEVGPQLPPAAAAGHQPQTAPTAAAGGGGGGWESGSTEVAAGNGHVHGPAQQQQQRPPGSVGLDVLGRKLGLPGMNGNGSSSGSVTKIGGPNPFVRARVKPAAAAGSARPSHLKPQGQQQEQPQQQQQPQPCGGPAATAAAAAAAAAAAPAAPPGSLEELKAAVEAQLRAPELGWWQQVRRRLQAAKEAGASLQGVLGRKSEERKLCRKVPNEVLGYSLKALEGLLDARRPPLQ